MVETTDEAIYLAIALRNVGTGLAVLDRWELHADRMLGEQSQPDPKTFRRLTRASTCLPATSASGRERSERPMTPSSSKLVRGSAPAGTSRSTCSTGTMRAVSARSAGSP